MNLEKTLENYGLNEKEAKVYLACLELGSASVQKISRKAVVPRTTVYEILEGLQRKGFVSNFLKKKIKYFSVETPQKIIGLTREKLELLEEALPQMNALYGEAKARPTVRFYQGRDQMKIILKEVLSEAHELLGFASTDDLFTFFGSWWDKFIEQRLKRKIPARIIVRESEKARERQRLGPEHLRVMKIIPAEYEYHGVVLIWGEKIAMFSFKKDLVALVIESKELALMQKAMYQVIWDMLGDE